MRIPTAIISFRAESIYSSLIFFCVSLNKWSMNYSSLEDAFGTPFGQRVPVTQERSDKAEPEPTKKADQSEKHKDLVESVSKSLP